MNTKLTIKLDEEVIEQAKIYAKKQNISLSKLIEYYLAQITSKQKKETINPIVKELSGILKLPKNLDAKKAYRQHILNKYK